VIRHEGLPRIARLLIGGAVLGGLTALTIALAVTGRWDTRDVQGMVAVIALMLVAEFFWVSLPYGREAENFSLVGVIFTAGLMLVRPGPLLVAVAIGIGVGQLPRRPPGSKLTFNVGQHVIGLGIASAIFAELTHSGQSNTQMAVAAIAAMAGYFVVNEVAVGAIIAAVGGGSFARVTRQSFRISAETWAGDVALGLIAVLLWRQERWYLIALIAPLVLSYNAMRSRIRTRTEAERTRQMALAAAAISQQEDLGRRMPDTDESPHLAALASTLNRMLERLESAFHRERRFIRDASHELRTPVTITRGYLEVLGSNPGPDELREAIDVAMDELDRMGRLITDLTTLARVDDPGFVVAQPLALDGFFERIAAKVRGAMEGRVSVAPAPPGAVVLADDQRLTQAVLNLLQNAVVHTDGRGPVELRAVEVATGWRLEVADNGGGVPAGQEDAIFQPFRRVDADRPGSGLGLAIVKGIVEGHAGAVGVDNRPGDGATFWIELPHGEMPRA
jgi:signal transduction histidine kinase